MFKKFSVLLLSLSAAFALIACSTAQQHYVLGQQYFHAQNYLNAFKEINTAAQQGNINAQYALGYMYINGIGTQADNTAGLFWIKQAAAKGQPQAKKALKMLTSPQQPS